MSQESPGLNQASLGLGYLEVPGALGKFDETYIMCSRVPHLCT